MLRIKIKPYSYRTESFLSFKDDQTLAKRPETSKESFLSFKNSAGDSLIFGLNTAIFHNVNHSSKMTSQSETEYFVNFLRVIDIIDSNDNRREEIQNAFNQLNRQMNAIDRNTFQDFNRICPRIIQNLKVYIMFCCVF